MAKEFDVKINFSEIERMFDNLVRDLKTYDGVKVGYIDENKKYKGTDFSLKRNALTQEFGEKIDIPEQRRKIYKQTSKRDATKFNKKGRFVKAKQSNWEKEVIIPAHTVIIPPRPFMRNTVEKNGNGKWQKDFDKRLGKEMPLKKILLEVGDEAKKDLQNSIESNIPPPNAKSTIRRKKGTNMTLQNTGILKKAIKIELIKGKK